LQPIPLDDFFLYIPLSSLLKNESGTAVRSETGAMRHFFLKTYVILLAVAVVAPAWATGLLARNAPAGGTDPALDRLKEVLAHKSYSVFFVDTVIGSADAGLQRDVIFVGCNGAVDCAVEGSVVMVDGELGLRSQAAVGQDVIVVRGSLFQSRSASVAGTIYRAAGPEGAEIVKRSVEKAGSTREIPFQLEFRTNRMGGFGVDGYDRVDGFSASWGFSLVQPQLDDIQIFSGRVISATTRQAVGFDTQLRLPLDRSASWQAQFGARSRTDTNDRWRLDDLENAFKAFVAGNDHRYYFRREGYSAGLVRLLGNHSQIGLFYQNERYYSLTNQSPFTLFGEENFHSNLPVQPGSIHSLILDATLDTRNDPYFTLNGFRFEFEGEIAGGRLGGDHPFARYDISLKRWDTFGGIHHAFFWFKLAGADEALPFQRCYTLGNTLRGYDNFAFSGDRMLMAQGTYGISLPALPVVEYVFFRWMAEAVYETGIAFYHNDSQTGYGSLRQDAGVGFTGDTIIGRIGFHLFQNLDASFRSGRRLAVTLDMNVFG